MTVSLLTQMRALSKAEFRAAWRGGETLMVTLPFAVAALMVVPLAIGTDQALLERIGPGVVWSTVLVFASFVVVRSDGGIDRDLVRMLGVDPAAVFAARAFVGSVFLGGFVTVMGLAGVVLYDFSLERWWWVPVIGVSAVAALAMITTLAAAVTTGLEARSTLTPLLVVPLAIPVLLAATEATESLRSTTGNLGWILLLVMLDLGLAIAGVLTARPLQEATR